MKSEKQIERHINAIERQIDRGGDYRELKAEQDALEWVLGYFDKPRKDTRGYKFYTMVDGKRAILLKSFRSQDAAEKYAHKITSIPGREYCLYYHDQQINFWN